MLVQLAAHAGVLVLSTVHVFRSFPLLCTVNMGFANEAAAVFGGPQVRGSSTVVAAS